MTETERKAKAAALARAWHWRNRDYANAKSRAYRLAHKPYFAAKVREYAAKHRVRLARQAKARKLLKRLFAPPQPAKRRGRPPISKEERLARRQIYTHNYTLEQRNAYNAKRRELYWQKRDSELARGRLYRQRNKAALRARGRARYWRNHEQSLQWSRQSYAKNKEARRIGQKLSRLKHRDRVLRGKRDYYTRKHGRRSPEWRARRHARAVRKRRTYMRKRCRDLTSAYVRHLLCRGTNLKPADFAPEIVRLERAKLRLLRAARNKQEQDGSKNKKHDRHPAVAG